jgi:hypothetical protein
MFGGVDTQSDTRQIFPGGDKMKLGPGEYTYTEDANNAASSEARRIFLSYIEELAPEVMKELEALMAKQGLTMGNLLSEVDAWAKKNNLNEKWIKYRALNTLLAWKYQPEDKGRWCYEAISLGLVPEIESFYFRAEEWKPEQKTWFEYEKYLDEVYQILKAEYREQKERATKAQGLEKAPAIRNREHFAWLVRYQVQGWKYREIADDHSFKTNYVLTDDNIAKGIKRAARLVEIQVRSAKKTGRPAKC